MHYSVANVQPAEWCKTSSKIGNNDMHDFFHACNFILYLNANAVLLIKCYLLFVFCYASLDTYGKFK